MSLITQEQINERAAELRKLRKDFKAQNERLKRDALFELGEAVAAYSGAGDVEAIKAQIAKFKAGAEAAEEAAKRSADEQQPAEGHDYNSDSGYGY
ncbi:hypothetical protein [Propionimicrobium lymphophilum]|uniref:hypothetical protein n=1 Tax=Propionimicrobium lymphophilum TaxID=33012 RepID=UPI00040751BB|nr:hypothetical protein [Propionimicrobium lymphophilum]